MKCLPRLSGQQAARGRRILVVGQALQQPMLGRGGDGVADDAGASQVAQAQVIGAVPAGLRQLGQRAVAWWREGVLGGDAQLHQPAIAQPLARRAGQGCTEMDGHGTSNGGNCRGHRNHFRQ